jgi:hypothetical protein
MSEPRKVTIDGIEYVPAGAVVGSAVPLNQIKDWLYEGKRVGHRNTSDQWRRHGTVTEVHGDGYFVVKWDKIKRPERLLRNDLTDAL